MSESQKETYKKWKELVNMSASELKRFMDSDEGKKAGLSRKEAKELGIHYGRESARWILKMKETPVSEWTPKMWEWANRQISFNSRMRGNKGKLYDDKGRKTRKHLSLLIWGHNPEKYENGGEVLLAPNGNPSNLTPEQYKLVRSDAFIAWFGDWINSPETSSKVIDENGEPLVVYHGTNEDFTVFNKEKQNTKTGFGDFGAGFYFTASLNTAKYYTLKSEQNRKILSVFLNIKNPFIIELNWEKLSESSKSNYKNLKGLFDWQKDIIKNGLQNDYRPSKAITKGFGDYEFQDLLIRNAYDGVFVNRINIFENPDVNNENQILYLHEIVVFESTQIKLADRTNTTFDSNNPDIRFSLGGEIEEYKKQGILDLNFYPTNSKHAKEHGIDAKNPLYLQNLIVKESDRLKFIGKKVLLYLDEYAKQNGNDVIFGYVNQKATMTKDNRTGYFTEFTDVDWIKHWLFRNGYCVKRETNNFYKVLDKEKKDKCDSFLLAPNGKPSNLNPEQYKLVRTPEFKAWFGDWQKAYETGNYDNVSKVIDEETKEPLVVYHGSPKNFNTFDVNLERGKHRRQYSLKGNYFAKDEWTSRQYAGSDGYVKKYFLNARKILTKGTIDEKTIIESLNSIRQTPLQESTIKNLFVFDNIDDFIEDIGQKSIILSGYDGVIDNNEDFIVFSSNQIKLADGTNTTFDANNPDIRFDDGGKVETDVNLFAPIPILKKDRFDEIYKTNIESLNIDEISEKAFLGNIEASNGDVLDLYGQEINVSSNYSKKFIRKITAINEKSEVILAFWEKNNDVIINFLSSSSSPYSHKLQIKQKRGKPTHKKQKLGYGSDLVKILSTQAKKLGKEKIIADDVIAFKSEKYWEKLGFVQENDDIGNRVLYLKNYNNNFELGGEITLTSEQVENKLGRELHWWNDDVVSINGIEYKKVFLKDEYKKI